ncbi:MULTISPECIES: tyrosine-type recombinase/integrase [unclassified Asaia]|uniref:tyrosine-type recombinase/integrase n=1 Tax=unclassified Asaia TaxID=2685023 RepID=UPI00301B0FF6
MIDEVRLFGSRSAGRQAVLDRLDGTAIGLIGDGELRNATVILSQAVFSPPLSVVLAGGQLPNGDFAADTAISEPAETSDQALVALRRMVGVLPKQHKLTLCLEVESGVPRFVGALEDAGGAGQGKVLAELPPCPIGQPPAAVSAWFSHVSSIVLPEHDGTLQTARDAAEVFNQLAKSGNTLRTYRSAVRGWCRWASDHNLPALPARSDDVAAYLSDMALRARKVSTIDIHRAALRYLHHLAQIAIPTSHPLVSGALAGIRRNAINPQPEQKTALTWESLTEAVDAILGLDPTSRRDRAILLLGFAGAFRRSELSGLLVSDLTFSEDGLIVRLRHSKGDKARKGELIGIPSGITRHCPILALNAWLRVASIKEGSVFRRVWIPAQVKAGMPSPALPKIGVDALSDRAIADIIRKRCAAAGLEGDFSGHSLRRGAINTGAQDGYDLLELKRFSRHKSLQVVETYIDEASVKARNPGRSRF